MRVVSTFALSLAITSHGVQAGVFDFVSGKLNAIHDSAAEIAAKHHKLAQDIKESASAHGKRGIKAAQKVAGHAKAKMDSSGKAIADRARGTASAVFESPAARAKRDRRLKTQARDLTGSAVSELIRAGESSQLRKLSEVDSSACTSSEWDEAEVYPLPGSKVRRCDSEYVNSWWSINEDPADDSSGNWQFVRDCDSSEETCSCVCPDAPTDAPTDAPAPQPGDLLCLPA